MLTEFLLTPDTFAETSDDTPIETLRALQNCLFPFAATPSGLVCNLGGNQWIQATSRKILHIQNSNLRALAQALFTKIVDEVSVSRPLVDHQGNAESDWITSGIKSSNKIPLNGIVVSGRIDSPTAPCLPMATFVSSEHWLNYQNPRLVGRTLSDQEDVLRVFCTHSDWIVVRMPQIYAGSDDEIVTIKQIIKLATNLPDGFKKSDIEIHLCKIPKIQEQNLLRGVALHLKSYLQQGVNVTLKLWPEKHFVNREIIGGDYTSNSEAQTIPRPRWMLTMTHVAIGSQKANNAGESGNTWSLFSRNEAFNHFEDINRHVPIQQIDAKDLI